MTGMGEDFKDSERINHGNFVSPREWYKEFRQHFHSKTWDNIRLLYPQAGEGKGEKVGQNTTVDIFIIRHGERNPDDTLKEIGKQQARDEMDLVGVNAEEYNLFRPIASYAGPADEFGLPRSSRTARVAAEHILEKTTKAGSDREPTGIVSAGAPDSSEELNYQKLRTKAPYDHTAIYNEALVHAYAEAGYLKKKELDAARKLLADAKNIQNETERRKEYGMLSNILEKTAISNDESLKMAERAQVAVLDHLASLDTPGGVDAKGEGEKYRNEAAGATAHLILHYADIAQKTEPGAKIGLVAGAHGGTTSEWMLRDALVWMNPKTNSAQRGFDSFEEIGGPIRPAESYRIRIQTDDKGDLKGVFIKFTRPDRPQGECPLDMDKLQELAAFYEDLHKTDKKDMTPQEYFDQHIRVRQAS